MFADGLVRIDRRLVCINSPEPPRPGRLRTYVRTLRERVMPAETPEIEVDDLVVLLLGTPGPGGERGRIEGVTRLEKLAFLIEKEDKPAWLTEHGDFISHNFGPFSAKIYTAVDTLAAAGLVHDSGSLADSTEDAWETEHVIGERPSDPYATRNFELTELGERYYDALIRELPPTVSKELQDFKLRFAGLPLRQLIRYVYERYPDFTDKSIIRDDVLG